MDVRSQLYKKYEIDEDGVILSKGKYEGQMIYVPYFWNLYGDPMKEFTVCQVYRWEMHYFHELENKCTVILQMDENGNVEELDDHPEEDL